MLIERTGISAGDYAEGFADSEVRRCFEGDRGGGKLRGRRGRRPLPLMVLLLLLLLRRFFCDLLLRCFLRCHVNSTPFRCENVDRCRSSISEFERRVKFSLQDF